MFAAAAIVAGAGLGALLRWWLALMFNPVYPLVPLGTLAANLTGGLLVGVAMSVFQHFPQLAPEWRLFAVTGFLGGLTTFSTFSAEVVNLMVHERWLWAMGVAGVHLAGSLALTGLGLALVNLAVGRP